MDPRPFRATRTVGLTALVLLVIALGGCGELTTRTWITIVEDESGGFVNVQFLGGPPVDYPIVRLQGGFLAEVVVNLADLPGPMTGSITLTDVRIAGQVEGLVGRLCAWNDPSGTSEGSLVIDVLGGNAESTMELDALAFTDVQRVLNWEPMDFEQPIDFDLGAVFDLQAFADAFLTGSADELFATSATISSTIVMPPPPEPPAITSIFNLDASVTNGSEPPTIDDDLEAFCQERFATQGVGDRYVRMLNVKSSYLRHHGNDRPLDPLVLDLAALDAGPGDVLTLRNVGTFAAIPALKDGADTRLGGVFSSSDVVLPSEQLFRIPGAIDTGPELDTWVSIVCRWGICTDHGGDDVPYDFPIDPQRTITVPTGAQYLIVAPVDGWRAWRDNLGLGFGLSVEVSP
ncbi:MAG: hypothetical protein ACQGVK_03315 [Myxococcota bacterium]